MLNHSNDDIDYFGNLCCLLYKSQSNTPYIQTIICLRIFVKLESAVKEEYDEGDGQECGGALLESMLAFRCPHGPQINDKQSCICLHCF